MKSVLHFLIAAVLAVPGASVALGQSVPATLTLSDAVRLALERNPEVLIAREQLEELKGKITEVRADAYPQVTMQGFGLRLRDPSILNSASFDKLPDEFRSALVPRGANLFDVGLTVTQPLYNAGKVGTAIKLALEGQREKEAALEAVRQRVAFKVFQAFHDLLLAQANLEVVRETYRQREKHLEQARSRFALGVATETDVLRSQVNLANTEPERIRAENTLRLARAALNNLIVADLDAPTAIEGKLDYLPWTVPPATELQGQALEVRPEVLVAKRLLQEARLLGALARSENKLKVDLEGRYGYNIRNPKNLFNQDFNRWNVTLNFRLPFYDGGRKAGQVVQADSRQRAAEHNLAQLENNVRLEIKAATDDLQSSAEAIAAARLNVSQAEKVLEMMQANYQYGAATTLDVMDSQTALTIARNAEINATYQYQIAKGRLRLAAGMPILDGEVKQ
ncbi:MAG: TolC family protein [Acidobacteriia bacterium]|nr:TolC family protein [Terriglobia bacterium]